MPDGKQIFRLTGDDILNDLRTKVRQADLSPDFDAYLNSILHRLLLKAEVDGIDSLGPTVDASFKMGLSQAIKESRDQLLMLSRRPGGLGYYDSQTDLAVKAITERWASHSNRNLWEVALDFEFPNGLVAIIDDDYRLAPPGKYMLALSSTVPTPDGVAFFDPFARGVFVLQADNIPRRISVAVESIGPSTDYIMKHIARMRETAENTVGPIDISENPVSFLSAIIFNELPMWPRGIITKPSQSVLAA